MVTQYKPYPLPMSLGTGFGDVFDSVHMSVFYSVRVCAQVRACMCVRMRVCACVFMVGGSLDETLRGRKEQTLCEKHGITILFMITILAVSITMVTGSLSQQ